MNTTLWINFMISKRFLSNYQSHILPIKLVDRILLIVLQDDTDMHIEKVLFR